MSCLPDVEKTVCLVVDIQERLTPVLHRHETFTAGCIRLLQGIQALSVPILLTEQYPQGLGGTIPAVKAQLAGVPVIEKSRFSAWSAETEGFIRRHEAENVVLMGAETHICVLQTALDLRAAGFGVYLPFECAASRDPLNKENGLQQMREAGVSVGNIESLLFALLRDAKHPAFKAISKLVR
ncbi:MAG: isochorismatase family protein [Neisseria sp.]|nr:isochorismatase family protein [Neisseria sp.]